MSKRAVAAAEIRADVLDTAKTYVLKDRNATHGDPEDNFGRIAELWSAYKRVQFNATDVAAMMALMKVARIAQSPEHRDSWIDLAGYAACGAGIALQKHADEDQKAEKAPPPNQWDDPAYTKMLIAAKSNPRIPTAEDTQNQDYDEVVKRLPDKATRK